MTAPVESESEREQRYVGYVLDAIRVAARKPPQFGTGRDVSLEEFKRLYGEDPFYAWIGFDSDLLYTAHRAGAAVTSLYRKLGDGCQELWLPHPRSVRRRGQRRNLGIHRPHRQRASQAHAGRTH